MNSKEMLHDRVYLLSCVQCCVLMFGECCAVEVVSIRYILAHFLNYLLDVTVTQ